MKKQDGKKKRSKIKYPALVPKYNSRVRQEYLDYDYLDQLNESELEWLNKFSEEYNNASFKNNETDIDQSPEGRKGAYDRNNARNRCLYGQIKNRVANTKLVNYDDMINIVEENMSRDTDPLAMENAYTDYLDYKEVNQMMLDYDAARLTYREERHE